MFGQKSPAEKLRQHQRALNKSIRELERETKKLETQEKNLVKQIKQTAQKGNQNVLNIEAKDLIRTRRNIQKFYVMKTQLQGVSLRMQTLKSTQAMTDAMKGVSKVMRQMNRKINLPQIQKIMTDFEKESELMDMKEEMVGDAIDSVFDEEGDEEESNEIVQKVLDEIGISIQQSISTTANPVKAAPAIEEESAADDLEARLENLRKA